MKKHILAFFLLHCLLSCTKDKELKVQEKETYQFDRIYGTAGTDVFTSLCSLTNNNLLCAGYTNGAGNGGNDGWLVLISPWGEKITSKTFGGSADDFFLSVMNTNDGNFLLTGYSYSSSAGQEDVWIVKVDQSLNTIWEKRMGGIATDLGINAINDNSGGYIISASTQSKGAGSLDHWLIKLDAAGNVLTEKTFGEVSIQGYASIMKKSDGNYFLCGRTDKNGNPDIDVIETNDNLDSLNEFVFGTTAYEEPKNILETNAGDFILCGHTAGFGHTEHNFYALRFTNTGTVVWENNYGSMQHDGAEHICRVSENTYLLTGRSNGNPGLGEDLLSVIIDENGNQKSFVYTGASGTDQGSQSLKNPGAIYTAGRRELSGGDTDGYLIARQP